MKFTQIETVFRQSVEMFFFALFQVPPACFVQVLVGIVILKGLLGDHEYLVEIVLDVNVLTSHQIKYFFHFLLGDLTRTRTLAVHDLF